MITMMTRRDVLDQLKRVGIHELSLLKKDCREFENYMAVYYGYKILKKESDSIPALSTPNSTPPTRKNSMKLRRYKRTYSGLPSSPLGVKSEKNKGQ
jgi:hypothetical protein